MQIQIRHYEFDLSSPYSPGKPMTKGEAQALNSLRAERIRSQGAKLFARLAPDGAILIPTHEALLRGKIEELDRDYQFPLDKQASRPKSGTIESEAQFIAREQAEEWARGCNADAMPKEEEIERVAVERATMPSVLDEARRRVEARRRIVASSLAELL